MFRTLARVLLGLFFVFTGVMHFHAHAGFVAIMPPYLPWPDALVDISGVAEILGGIGIQVKWTRNAAGVGLVLLLVAVFPANIHMAVNHVMPPSWHLPIWALWLRLPFQGVLIAWVWWVAIWRSDHVSRLDPKVGRPLS